MDRLTKQERSRNMAAIRGTNTGAERVVRSLLHRLGYRFRLHRRGLPGTPDIVLPRYRAVVFVHGCFWHQHPGCRFAYMPKSNVSFWKAKFEGNRRRDDIAARELGRLGWKVIVVWECEAGRPEVLARRLSRLLSKKPTGAAALAKTRK